MVQRSRGWLWRMNNEVIFNIGNRHHWGGESAFGFSLTDLRHHCYVIGKTGSGKTTLLRNLILQLAEGGHGVGLIDPPPKQPAPPTLF